MKQLSWIAALGLLFSLQACRSPQASTDSTSEPAVAENSVGGLAENATAPVLEGVDVEGETFSLADYRGKVVVLDFWGFW